jgi:hypothetical protein
MRLAYISSILSQDTAYFDTHGCGEITTRSDKDIDTIEKGYGEHLGRSMHLICYVIAVSEVLHWKNMILNSLTTMIHPCRT